MLYNKDYWWFTISTSENHLSPISIFSKVWYTFLILDIIISTTDFLITYYMLWSPHEPYVGQTCPHYFIVFIAQDDSEIEIAFNEQISFIPATWKIHFIVFYAITSLSLSITLIVRKHKTCRAIKPTALSTYADT